MRLAESAQLNETVGRDLAETRERIDRLAKGEDVAGGLHAPMTREELIAKMGLSKREVWRMDATAALSSAGLFDEMLEKSKKASLKASERASDAVKLRMLRDHISGHD
jgi:hypothetical protein